MNKIEKEAIERLKGADIKVFLSGMAEQSNYIVNKADETNIAIETVLNLIQTQQEEIEILKQEKATAWEEWNIINEYCEQEKQKYKAETEKKDKIIDEAISWIKSLHDSLIEEYGDYETEFSAKGKKIEEDKIKEYFIHKVEEEN